MTNIKDLTIAGRTAIEAEKSFNVDRAKFMTASEAESCIRKQWYSKRPAFEPQEQDWGFAWRGTHMEKYMAESLEAANVPLRFAGDDQFTLHDPETKIAATPDGVIAYEDEWVPIEFKTIDPRTNKKNLPRSGHVTQLKIGMKLLDQYHDNPGIRYGLLVYTDASNYNDIIQFRVDFEDGILEEMAPRARQVLGKKSADALDREGKKNGDCRYCSYTEVCGVDVAEATGRTKGNRGSKIETAAQRHVAIKDEEEALKIEKAALSEDIKADLKKRETNSFVAGDIVIELSEVKGRTSLDKKAAKAAGVNLAPFEKVGASSERLLVKRVS